MKTRIMFVAGVFAGIASVVACRHAGNSAKAGPNDCSRWQIGTFSLGVDCPADSGGPSDPACTLPNGWEPMSFSTYDVFSRSNGTIYARRCAP